MKYPRDYYSKRSISGREDWWLSEASFGLGYWISDCGRFVFFRPCDEDGKAGKRWAIRQYEGFTEYAVYAWGSRFLTQHGIHADRRFDTLHQAQDALQMALQSSEE